MLPIESGENILISWLKNVLCTVKLEFKEQLNKEQLGNGEAFPVTNMKGYLINSERFGISEQFCNDQKVP